MAIPTTAIPPFATERNRSEVTRANHTRQLHVWVITTNGGTFARSMASARGSGGGT